MLDLDLILLITLPTLIIYGVAARIRRARVRARADQIIAGKQITGPTTINKFITILTASNKWLIGRSEQDWQRTVQLRNIRDNLITKHN